MGDSPVICKEWQCRSRRNKLASCDILLPMNAKFHVAPKLWLNLWWFWTCPHFQDCELNLQIISTLICILISQRKLTNPSFPAQQMFAFFSENLHTVHCNTEAWAVSEILVTNHLFVDLHVQNKFTHSECKKIYISVVVWLGNSSTVTCLGLIDHNQWLI